MRLTNSDPQGYGPIFGTPNAGRAERIERAEREGFRRAAEASDQQRRIQERNELSYGPTAFQTIHYQIRRLTDHLDDERSARLALEERVAELTEALRYIHSARIEVSRNGTAQTARR
jgi:hypothetical protein